MTCYWCCRYSAGRYSQLYMHRQRTTQRYSGISHASYPSPRSILIVWYSVTEFVRIYDTSICWKPRSLLLSGNLSDSAFFNGMVHSEPKLVVRTKIRCRYVWQWSFFIELWLQLVVLRDVMFSGNAAAEADSRWRERWRATSAGVDDSRPSSVVLRATGRPWRWRRRRRLCGSRRVSSAVGYTSAGITWRHRPVLDQRQSVAVWQASQHAPSTLCRRQASSGTHCDDSLRRTNTSLSCNRTWVWTAVRWPTTNRPL